MSSGMSSKYGDILDSYNCNKYMMIRKKYGNIFGGFYYYGNFIIFLSLTLEGPKGLPKGPEGPLMWPEATSPPQELE